MAKDTDELFVQIALEKRFLTEEQVGEVREAAETLDKVGMPRSFSAIVREKEMLSRPQLREMRRELRKHGVLPTVGGYEILSKLGEGGMGAVYKAQQVSLDRAVALKILPPELARNEQYVKRFEREARLAARVSHPNVVQVYAVGESGGRRYIAMELVSGSDLAGVLKKSGPLAEGRALEILLGAARGLAVAHEVGIVHRDIKPTNIMLTEKGMPKLADLGLARDIQSGGVTLTRSGQIMGTPQYMSPEQCRGRKDIDHRTDIYSLGATLFHMVCGRVPFEGDSAIAIVQKQLHEPLPDPKSLRPELSDGMVSLIRLMMEKDRDRRFQNCEQLIEAIGKIKRGGDLPTLIEPPPARPPVKPLPTPPPPPPAAAGAEESSLGEILEAAARAEGVRPAGVSAEPEREGRRFPLRTLIVVLGVLAVIAAIVITAGALIREAAEKEVRLPKDWSKAVRRVKVATPHGEKSKEITYYKNSIGMEFVKIPAGEFMMGSPANEKERRADEGPQHRVRITKPFYMGAHEVTQEQYEKVMGKNPAHFKSARNPVEKVSWHDAVEFCKRLSQRDGVGYRLPTEAEWEYACRAGTTTRFYFGDRDSNLGDYAWYSSNSGSRTHPVGQKKPNAFGLCDMHGNVWEWCADWYDSGYYKDSPTADPSGPRSGSGRVNRGGGWIGGARYCRSAGRDGNWPGDRGNNVGFRLVRTK